MPGVRLKWVVHLNALAEIPALEPYWGNPNVRFCKKKGGVVGELQSNAILRRATFLILIIHLPFWHMD
jgi:hypothetical protein